MAAATLTGRRLALWCCQRHQQDQKAINAACASTARFTSAPISAWGRICSRASSNESWFNRKIA